MTSFERATLNFAKLAFAVSVVAAIFVGLQWKVMRDTLDEMKRSGDAATNQLWQAIGNMNWMARTADGSLQQSQRSMRNSEAQTHALIDASKTTMQLDKRAWVIVNDIGFDAPLKPNTPFTLTFAFKNTGATPALRARWDGEWVVTGPCKALSRMTSQKFLRDAETGIGPGQQVFVGGLNGVISPLCLAEYASGESALYLIGKMTYYDIFGNRRVTSYKGRFVAQTGQFTEVADGNDLN